MNINFNISTKKICMRTIACAVLIILSTAAAIGVSLLFPIQADKCYGWWHGLWHSEYIVNNLILSFFQPDRLLIAPIHTTGYAITYWSGIVLSIISLFALSSFALALFFSILIKKNQELDNKD